MSLILVVFTVITISPVESFAQEIIRNKYEPIIEQKLNDLVALEQFNEDSSEIEIKNPSAKNKNKQETKNKKKKFNKEKAEKNSKISKESIKLKNSLAEYNNLIIEKTKNGENIFQINTKKEYPDVDKFFEELNTLDKNYQIDTTKTSAINLSGNLDVNANPVYEALVRSNCGYFYNPKPSSSAPKPSSWYQDPEKTLYSWGYHRTANYATGREYGIYDYTRNITWNPYYCKWNSFRDHAGIDTNQWGGRSNILREQKYWGYTPNGECNPEIHSYIWPYGECPVYCKWWHDRN